MNGRWRWLLGSVYGGFLVFSFVIWWQQPAASGIPATPGDWPFAQEQRSEELDTQMRNLSRRMEARDHVLNDLFAGRITWARAVECFGELNRWPPDCTTTLRMSYGDCSEEECAERQLMAHIRHVLRERPTEADAIRRFFQAQHCPICESPDASSHLESWCE
jgi:hypothetical protein